MSTPYLSPEGLLQLLVTPESYGKGNHYSLNKALH